MLTEKEMEEIKAKNQKRQEKKMNHVKQIIKAENDLTDFSNDFIKFLTENKNLIIGKRIEIQTGKSKVFSDFMNKFNRSYEGTKIFSHFMDSMYFRIRACVTSGSYEDNTYQCMYIDRVIYDCFKTENGICTAVRENLSDYPVYSFESVIQAKEKIKLYEEEIQKLKGKISVENRTIPHVLTGNLYI